ncbi:hypothetical protein M409DRAFT_59872 [Zasmidium cellare ATCC 36951]|uniref:Mid2 domain-containing protein n=1 Tax=Zasmidium cellare ATCC 36951 TaxID=1080233 RepID=A0A6A6C4F4_ZASCE|nr:uncharacterized protein M409DRAFT_59872 [Zasmidium cellare ATCC 36951]KAF2160619.1 hypothetical protein M409DRAFT_59872 [Zasmidium cellare ATCC 36951]
MMMNKRRPSHWRGDLDALDEFWEELWSAVASRVEERTAAVGTESGTSTMAPPPVFTVSVTTTILSTTFVTVPYSSEGAGSLPAATDSVSSSRTSIPSSPTSISSTSRSSSSLTTTNLDTVLPTIVTASSQIQLPPIASSSPSATSPGSSAANETSNSMIGMDSQSESQKKAVVGGLSGTIAGLIFIGVLICLILRVRRKKHEPKEEPFDAASEKEVRPNFFRTWTGITIAGGRDRPRTAQPRPESTSSVTVDEDHRIIRMNTRHWPRPFAPGAGEGYRDSVPHGQLRVMNPDLSSRPITPRRSSDTPSSFLRKQRSALTGFVFGAPRSSQSRNSQSRDQQQQHPLAQSDIPTITVVDPTLSRECIAPYARTPSFKSYPSINTLPIVRQEPPEDPFVTPPNNTQPPPPIHDPHRVRRPSLSSSLHSTATKTWSHLLHPFRPHTTTTTPIQNVRNASHFSVSTSNSNSNSSYRRSDPFDLSVRGGGTVASPRMGSEFARRGSESASWILYEGT